MITGEQGARKPASPVREETDGKGPGQGHLAGGRLHAEGGLRETTGGNTGTAPAGLPYKAAWSFFEKGEPASEEWVADQARKILRGKSAQVAAGIRRRATTYGYSPAERAGADECARYLNNKKDYLGYATALGKGWPIATGIIEGAARWLVKDRMDITGARWGLEGAEAILKLRALIASGDFDAYWRFHLRREHERIHHVKYRDGLILAA